jgi:ribosomal protein S20
MSTEEEISDGTSVEQKPPELMTAIEHFYMRKFKDHSGVQAEKRAILKATGSGSNKKQKTLVKSYVKEALQSLMEVKVETWSKEDEADDLMELSKEGLAEAATNLLETAPQHLTGTHDESRQAQ